MKNKKCVHCDITKPVSEFYKTLYEIDGYSLHCRECFVDIETKICKKCGKEKPLSQFYIHTAMEDGHLNFCNDCVKQRVSKRWYDNAETLRQSERNRYHRRKLMEPGFNSKRIDYQRGHRTPEQNRAHNMVERNLIPFSICQICFVPCKPHGHHEDYSKPLEVLWCCIHHHAQIRLGKIKVTFLEGATA